MSAAKVLLSFVLDKIEDLPIRERLKLLRAAAEIYPDENGSARINTLIEQYEAVLHAHEQLRLKL